MNLNQGLPGVVLLSVLSPLTSDLPRMFNIVNITTTVTTNNNNFSPIKGRHRQYTNYNNNLNMSKDYLVCYTDYSLTPNV